MFGWDDAIGGVLKLADKFIPDPQEKQKFELELQQLKQQSDLAVLNADTQIAIAQADINKTEAASEDKFNSRARPFILWICGVAFGYHFIVQPLLAFVFATTGHPVPLPVFNMDALNTVLFGILGLGGMRTYEKINSSK